MTAVGELTIAASVTAWQGIGLTIRDGISWVGGVRMRFVEPAPGHEGILGWTLVASAHADAAIDGLATAHLDQLEVEHWRHELGVTAFDHVVVNTSSIERTCGAIEASTGAPLKRVREAGTIRQGFHRLGPVIVEVVEAPQITADHATFWGFVLVVDDIHEVAGRLGPEVVSLPRTAVQPGRFIASFRGSVGLGLPFAIMSA